MVVTRRALARGEVLKAADLVDGRGLPDLARRQILTLKVNVVDAKRAATLPAVVTIEAAAIAPADATLKPEPIADLCRGQPFGTTGPDAGRYALMGMTAGTAACSHAPLTSAVTVFDVQGDCPAALPIVVAAVVARARPWLRQSLGWKEAAHGSISAASSEGRRQESP